MRADELLVRVRRYWEIEGGLHQRLDVSAAEDASRVRNRNALLVLGILRRAAMAPYLAWRRRRKNKRQATLKDFHSEMVRFNSRLAFATITAANRRTKKRKSRNLVPGLVNRRSKWPLK